MKKIKCLVAGLISSALLFGTFTSCEQLLDILESAGSEIDKPSFDFKDISFKNLDSKGITLECQYDITNPYAINLNVGAVKVDVACEENNMGSIDASEGISMEAKSTKTNKFDWKIEYDSLLNLAKSYKDAGEEKDKLPFTFSGSVGLNNELLPGLEIPFSKNINAPVVKPSFSADSPKLSWPSKSEVLQAALTNLSYTDYLSFASSLSNDGRIDVATLKKLGLKLKLNFNLGVKNEGGSAWNYLLKNCSINATGAIDATEDSLIGIDTTDIPTISDDNGSIPLTAVLDPVTAGDFIASIISGKGSNPKFNIGSGVKFPNLGGVLGNIEIPLNYELELPLDKITK